MGYELKMKVGWLAHPSVEHKCKTVLEREGDVLGYPYEKDAKDNYIPTGRSEQIFFEVASVDLRKIYDTETYLVATKAFLSQEGRKKVKNVVKWFVDDTVTCQDSCGDMPTPVPIKKVLMALRKDVEISEARDDVPYSRFVWALALLEAVNKTQSDERKLVVLFEGH